MTARSVRSEEIGKTHKHPTKIGKKVLDFNQLANFNHRKYLKKSIKIENAKTTYIKQIPKCCKNEQYKIYTKSLKRRNG